MSKAWIYLLVASAFEVGFALSTKYNQGWTNRTGTVLTILTAAGGIYFLGLATKELPLGTSYMVWTGVSAVGTVILSLYLFKEPIGALKIACLFAILAGVVGLKYLSSKGV